MTSPTNNVKPQTPSDGMPASGGNSDTNPASNPDQNSGACPGDNSSGNQESASTNPNSNHGTPNLANKKLWQSAGIVSSMTLLSRILGFIRDIVLANLFGASGTFDAFIVAFKIPNFFRRLFAEGAFSQAFVPTFTEYKLKHDLATNRQFLAHIAGMLAFAIMICIAVVEITAPWVITLFAPGFINHPDQFALAEHMLRITFPYIMLIALTALAGGILNTHRQFAIPAFTPVLLNLSLISVAYFWAPHSAEPIITLAWAVPIGGVLQLALQIPFLIRIKQCPLPKLNFKDDGVRRILKLMVPALFGVSVAQISLMIDNIFASFLPAGSISWLYYSDRLTYLPLGVIGVALATVILPQLSQLHTQASVSHFKKTYQWATNNVLLLGLPAALGLAMLAHPLLATLFQHGAFNAHSTSMAARSLVAFALGLPAFMLIKILAAGFYAQKNIRTPVKIAALAMLTNLILNFILIKPLAHAGLALATSIAAWLNAGLLAWHLRRLMTQNSKNKQEMQDTSATTWLPFLTRILFACLLMALYIFYASPNDQWWNLWGTTERVCHLSLIILPALIIYLGSLWLSGCRIKHLRAPH